VRLDFEHSAERLRIVVGRRTEWSELLDLAFVALFGYVGWGVQYHPAAGRRTPWALFVAGYFIVAHVYHLLWTALGTQVIEVEQGGALRFYGEILGVRATLTKRSNLMEATTPRFEEKESRPLLERFFSKQHRGTITFDEKAKARHLDGTSPRKKPI
jgi:hypothetical protein